MLEVRLTEAWYDALVGQRLAPTESYGESSAFLKGIARQANRDSLGTWREILTWSRGYDPVDIEGMNERAGEWACRHNALCDLLLEQLAPFWRQ